MPVKRAPFLTNLKKNLLLFPSLQAIVSSNFRTGVQKKIPAVCFQGAVLYLAFRTILPYKKEEIDFTWPNEHEAIHCTDCDEAHVWLESNHNRQQVNVYLTVLKRKLNTLNFES